MGPYSQSHGRGWGSSGILFLFSLAQASKNIHVVKVGKRANTNGKFYFLYSLIIAIVLGHDQSYDMLWFLFCFILGFVI